MFRLWETRAGHYCLLIVLSAVLDLVNLGGPSLWDVDESHNAEAAREMLVSGNWIVPTFNFQLRSDKPALLYWLQIGAYRLFGVNEFAARFPSALASMGTVLVTYELGRRLFGPATGLIAGVVLASTAMFCAAAHFANPDALLLVFTTLTLLVFWHSFMRGTRSWFVGAAITTGLAVLAKGPVGIVLPMGVIVLFLLWVRKPNLLCHRRLLTGCLVFAAVALPWYAWVGAETKWVFLREFLFVHNAARFRATMEGHGGPAFYYLICVALGFAPWSIFFGPALWCSWPKPGRRLGFLNLATEYRFLWCWIIVYVVFFTASATKLPNYVLPIYPPLALITAHFLNRWRLGELNIPGWLWYGVLTCLGLIGIGLAIALALAGGVVDAPFLRGRKFPELEWWGLVGMVPLLGSATLWWFNRRQFRPGALVSVAATAVLLTGLLAGWGTAALDSDKASRPLVRAFRAHQAAPEVRLVSYPFYKPSLVFYSRREVYRPNSEEETLDLLRYPCPVYLFVSAPVWNVLQKKVVAPCQVVDRHRDLYQGCEILLVTNERSVTGTR
jgi:4-amino-4-deoxy-L-arabinose transferase-like glycosyltransferase